MSDSDKPGPEIIKVGEEPQRLDLFLWFARFAKTRGIASRLVSGGKVRINRDKTTKPGRAVRPGDILTLNLTSGVRVVKVIATADRRGPAREAAMLYEEMVLDSDH